MTAVRSTAEHQLQHRPVGERLGSSLWPLYRSDGVLPDGVCTIPGGSAHVGGSRGLGMLDWYRRKSRRRRRHAARNHQRLDIQGLRMVAVLTVFASHLWGWPSGGFIGVDVFFVISGFLITGNLMRTAEDTGTVSFWGFYGNRIRRIVPAATVVLALTCVASALVFLPFRAREVNIDALWAFVFLSNWWFGFKDTDYFHVASDAVSPLQHYWSLSIEEQFYFVWPALIFLVSVLVIRKSWSHARRMTIAGGVMSVIVAASLAWALAETASSPAWAYFDTAARVWELGVGAVLACTVDRLARIPDVVRPALSWVGLAAIGASVVLISEDPIGFPAPWAILPVAGAALVIAAGVGREPKYQAFLRNPVSGYLGDISYSLYLVHWPVIILVGSVMDVSSYYWGTVIGLSFGLSVASYHMVETPFRRITMDKVRTTRKLIRKGRYWPQKASQYATLGSIMLLIVGLGAYAMRPEAYEYSGPPSILAALRTTSWPELDPSMEQVIESPTVDPAIRPCDNYNATVDVNECTYGERTAPIRIVLAGDSEGHAYAGPLRDIVLNSGGQLQLLNMSMASCAFTDQLVNRGNVSSTCEARKRNAVDTINSTKPDIVIISNLYRFGMKVDSTQFTQGEWLTSMRDIIDQFRPSTRNVVLLSGPPGEVNPKECFGKRSNVPADCIGEVTEQWRDMATAERQIADTIDGTWIDSRPWFCSDQQLCPSFVGTTATKCDEFHFAPVYGKKIYQVIAESLRAAAVLPAQA